MLKSSTTSWERAQPVIENLKHLVGGVPSIIEKNIKILEVVDETHIVCKPCGYNLEIVDDKVKTTKYFTDHFSDDVHKEKTSNVSNTYMYFYNKYKQLYPSREILPVILNNLEHLAVSGSNINCKICDKKNVAYFYCVSDLFGLEKDLSKHFLTNEHQEEIKKWNDRTNLVRVKLEEKYGTFPPSLVLNGVDHLVLSTEDDGYCCTLCNVPFRNNDILKGDLETHLQSDEHTNKVEDHKAITKIPILREIYSEHINNCEQTFFLPDFILKNIEYLEYYRYQLSCSVCAEDILYCINDKTFLGVGPVLKFHLTSSNHLDNLNKWRNPQNKEYKRLLELFGTFPSSVLSKSSCIGIKGKHFYCHLCKCLIIDENDSHYTAKNILAHLMPGYNNVLGIAESTVHEENLKLKENICENVKKEIMRDCEAMSGIISKNIPFLMDAGSNVFKCVICDAQLKLFENDPVRTNTVFEHHLAKSRHMEALQHLYEQKKVVIDVLEPYTNPLINDNLQYIEYKDTSDKNNKYTFCVEYDDDSSDDEPPRIPETTNAINFYCSLCEKVIIAGEPSKYTDDDDNENDLAKRVSEYNLTIHFSSGQHRDSILTLSSRVYKAKRTLNSVFGSIPNCVWANICHMSIKFHTIKCTLCDKFTCSVESIKDHCMYGGEASDEHAKRMRKLEIQNRLAMNIFKKRFWQVPELVVKNIGFLRISGDNFFCILCQETIYVDAYDLEFTEAAFYIHLNSWKHSSNVNGTLADWAKQQFYVQGGSSRA